MLPVESPLTRIPGAWADRHPVIVAALIGAALAALLTALTSTAHGQNAAMMSGVAPAIGTGPSNLLSACSLVIGSPPVLTIDTCKRTITAAPDVKTDDAARQVIDALRPYLAGMGWGP